LEFTLVYLKRLGAPIMDPASFPASGLLPCLTAGLDDKVDPYGTHFRGSCTRMIGLRTMRHTGILFSMMGALRESKAASEVVKEPHLRDLYERIPTVTAAATADTRADILAKFSNNERVIVDVTVCSPTAGSIVAGHSFGYVITGKLKKYAKQFQIPPRELNIFAIEHTGRLCLQARDFVKSVATRAAANSSLPGDYTRTSLAFYQRVSVGVQRGNATMLAALVSSCAGLR